jgi:oxygen-independent coproporphyrinogen-3 oxidase
MGIGPGAHGRLTRGGAADVQASQNKDAAHGRLTREGVRCATVAEPDLKAYTAAADPIAVTVLSPQEAEEEALMLGLRLIDGVRLSRVPNLNRTKAEALIADGFLERTPERLRATDKGRVVLDRLLLELLS